MKPMRERLLMGSWWFSRDGRSYLFDNLPDTWWFGDEGKIERIFCRLRGHAGEVFYNPGGYEPDHSCRRCGEDLE